MSDPIQLDATRLEKLASLALRSGDDGAYGFTEEGGFEPKPYQRLVEEGFGAARFIFGPNVDLANGSVLRKLIELNALSQASMHAAMARAVDDSFAVTARGAALSRIGEELGFPRPWLRAEGEVQIKAPAAVVTALGNNLTLPRGIRLRSSDGTRHVTTAHSVELAADTDHTVRITAFLPGPSHNLDPSVEEQKITELNPDDPVVKRLVGLLRQAPEPVDTEQFLQISHTTAMSGGERMWDDERYRALISRAPRSVWTLEAIQLAVELVPGVAKASVSDEFGGLDMDRPIFGNFMFGERMFGRDRDIFSPFALKVRVATEEGAIWDGPSGLREAVLAAVEAVRPIGVFADVDKADEVHVAVEATILVSTSPGDAFTRRMLERLDNYVGGLSLGEPVRTSRLIFEIMKDPIVVDVRQVKLWTPGTDAAFKAVEGETLPVPEGSIARFIAVDKWLRVVSS
jgi:hypothetical protein